MFGALAAVAGPPALGRAMGSALGLLDRIGEKQERKDTLKHERALAETAEGRAYLAQLHERNSKGEESLLSKTMCRLYLMFGATMCYFIVACILLQFDVADQGASYALPIKDPDQQGRSFSIAGIFVFKWGGGKIQDISPLGMAYLAYSGISFIITLTLTNRRRFR